MRSAILGRGEYTKLEQDAMLADAGEEDESIKCFDDNTGKELRLRRKHAKRS